MRRPSELLTTSEAARMFGVDPKTFGRWATRGLVPSIRTPGGVRRYRRAEVEALRLEHTEDVPAPAVTRGG
jgi:excisionase family DNA binding protein